MCCVCKAYTKNPQPHSRDSISMGVSGCGSTSLYSSRCELIALGGNTLQTQTETLSTFVVFTLDIQLACGAGWCMAQLHILQC